LRKQEAAQTEKPAEANQHLEVACGAQLEQLERDQDEQDADARLDAAQGATG